jgi:hypothetical protein
MKYRRVRNVWVSCLALVWAICAAFGTEASPEVQLRDLAGRQVEPLAPSGARATVFLFTRTDCPISNRYAPEIQRLSGEFGSQVTFWLVFVDPDQSAHAIRQYLREYHYSFGALLDSEHKFVHITGVQVTPEVAVFAPSGSGAKEVYRGRIDDQYVDFGQSRPKPTRHDLEEVLAAIVAGKPVEFAATRAVGCFIADLEKKR